jgi:transcription termination/antitermination protein NusG
VKRWYVVQVYPGYEERVKKDIESLVVKENLADLVGEVLVPSAKLRPLFDVGASGFSDQQLFPGYVLVEMELVPEAMGLVLASPQALKFLGGNAPIPLSRREIDRILQQDKGEVQVVVVKEEFEIGQELEIVDGPFAGFVGIVDKVDRNGERLTIMVSIFGRMTPVDLGFHQVKR